MPGTIFPLPVMLEEQDQKIYDQLEPPKTIVCRYGYMRMIAELAYDGDAKPGCGSKLVIRTNRGIELAEMLTTTCPNSGCGSAVSRKQMLQYIENSGGKNYPFSTHGKVLRVATIDDVKDQEHFDARKPDIIRFCKSLIRELDLPMALVEVELLLGGERVIFHYTSEQWVDFRELVRRLASEYQTRIEMHQVNARDEARIVADYEKCGQHCCCRQFLKVLKPVSMKSAKIQKATLDPTKISGRCGRLMCCLRYEDQTYDELRKRLPKKQTRVRTEDGPGTIIDTQILTQLVLVRLDESPGMHAYALEAITMLSREEDAKLQAEYAERQRQRDERMAAREARRGGPGNAPGSAPAPGSGPGSGPSSAPRGGYRGGGQGGSGSSDKSAQSRDRRPEPRRPRPGEPLREDEIESAEGDGPVGADMDGDGDAGIDDGAATGDGEQSQQGASSPDGGGEQGQGKKRRRRRRKRKRGNPGGNPGGGPGENAGGDGSDPGGGGGGPGGDGGGE